MSGLVFNIQRFSIHDGPGIRTTVFLQGCNLRCFWCHNPESNPTHPVVQFYPDKCIACLRCVEVCPQGAQLSQNGLRMYDRQRCVTCGKCVDECFSRALVMAAKEYSAGEVMDEVLKDRDYYRDSRGGVTFSGGEPLLQKDFLCELLQASRAAGLHCAVDTAANLPWQNFEPLLPLTDLFLVDFKAFDEQRHREVTGVSNTRIKANLQRLARCGTPIWVRVPVIPGVNDSVAEIERMAGFLAPLENIEWVELLPFHHLGASKYDSLDMAYTSKSFNPPADDLMQSLVQAAERQGVKVRRMV
jgi:pyruvate formate lyase activating enzyme